MSRIQRALISVSDKTGVVEFARSLHERGVDLLSTGGTSQALRAAGIPVRDISEFTGFPEMLDGRVKTLHPKVHGGLLFLRDNSAHLATAAAHGIEPIDLVCVNLYPFEATVSRAGVTLEEAVEQIDIGGPGMIRSAAKNYRSVTVVVDPADYGRVLASMAEHGGGTDLPLRLRLAQKVFARVAAYNAAIATYLAEHTDAPDSAPFSLVFSEPEPLRHGENPHQKGRLFRSPVSVECGVAQTDQLHGKEMSYNNYVDGHGSLEAARELCGSPGAVIVKHTNPCGFATGETLAEALAAAWEGDPVSAFGSVITLTQPVDRAAAEFLQGRFVEVVIAPDFTPEALELLTHKSKAIRLLKLRHALTPPSGQETFRQVGGGLLTQQRDAELTAAWECVTTAPFHESLRPLAEFGMKACKHVKSNAIVLVREWKPGCYQVVGMGAGQPNRVDSVKKLAIARAKENIRLWHEAAGSPGSLVDTERDILASCILVSDAFFPFPDNIDAAAEAGIRFVVEPGGSVKDGEVIDACNRHGIAMVLTRMRHFLH